MSQNARPVLIFFDGTPLQIEQITAIAQQQAQAALSPEPAFRERIQKGADFLDRLLAEDGVVYGVTTGYGDSTTCTHTMAVARAAI